MERGCRHSPSPLSHSSAQGEGDDRGGGKGAAFHWKGYAVEQGPGSGGGGECNSLKLAQQKVVLGRRQ